MLPVDPHLQGLLFFCIQWKQIVILIRAPVQHPAAAMHGGIDGGGVHAPILRLNVENRAIECDVGVMTEKHSLAHPNLTVADTSCRLFSGAALTQRRPLVIITLRP